MTRFVTAMSAAMAILISSIGSAYATEHREVCQSPEAPGSYYCRLLYVTLVPDADIDAVLDRVVPGAEPLSNTGERIEEQGEEPIDDAAYRQWEVLLAAGDDAVEARQLLLADAAVEDVALTVPGELTGPDAGESAGAEMPDTALPGAPMSVTIAGAALIALAGGLILGRRAD